MTRARSPHIPINLSAYGLLSNQNVWCWVSTRYAAVAQLSRAYLFDGVQPLHYASLMLAQLITDWCL